MADQIASNVVGTMLEPIRDSLYAFISRQFGYLVHCKKNIKDFEDEVDKLKDAMEMIQARVNEAENNAQVIQNNVTRWLTQVETSLPTMEQDKERLLLATQNLKRLHLRLRYRLGKEGKKKTTVVTNLIKDGNFVTVASRPPLTGIWHRARSIRYEDFQSRESVFKEITKALEDDRDYKIGIHGMPGVGKTRMMEELAEQAEKGSYFDEIVKIVVTQNPNLKDIQLKLAESLNLTLDKETEDARKGLLRNRLKNGKKILLMVDDVWNNEIKLEDIGIPAVDDHTKGCKIVLTSRIRDVWLQMGVQKHFEVGVLWEDEAWDLFKKTVGDSIERPELHYVAKEVCSECDRLPLAIVTIGAAMRYEEERHVWDDALHQLKHSKGNNIAGVTEKLYSCIELSYKYLKQKDLQSCFLYCCLFPEDADISIDDLVRYGVGTRFLEETNRESMETSRVRIRTVVDTLKKSNLLSNGSDKFFVKMHDVIRDVAISIASKEKDVMFLVKADVQKWPDEDGYKQCKAISLRLNNDCVLPDDSECTEVRTLRLEFCNLSSEVPSTFFKGMEKLEVLHLRNMWISTLPSSLKNLRMLQLISCQLVNLAFLKEFKKLEILSIQDYDLEELAPEIRQLTRLRLLDLRGCYNLKIIPSGVISSLSQFEEFYIPDEFDQWEVKDNASLNELNSLKHLISLEVHVPNVKLLPLNDELLFNSLIRFQISIGSKFQCNEIRSSATRILKLVDIPLKKELNILMEKAEVLYLIQLKGLKDVLHNRYGKGFQECDEMEHLLGKPKWINSQSNQLCASGSFSKLSELQVRNCQLMKYLFSAAIARGLPQLQRLHIWNCSILEEIVGDIEQEVMDTITFHQLKRIELRRLPNLRSFYGNTNRMSTRGCNTSTLAQALFNDKVAFPALEKLIIEELGSLTAIWDDQMQSLLMKVAEDSFRRLTYMKVFQCEKLVNVIPSNMLPRLQNLEILAVSKCNSVLYEVEVVGIVEQGHPIVETPTINVLPRLQEMVLWNLPNLVMYIRLNRLCAYSNLIDLHLSNRNNLGNALSLSMARYLVHLQKLTVYNCEKMEEIVAIESEQLREEDVVHDDEIIVFLQLKVLELGNLPNLKSICCCTRGSKKQEEESVKQKNMPRVEALFNHKIKLPALEELKINDLGSLTAIWDNELFLGLKGEKDSFQRLRNINVQKCLKLVNIIPPNVLPLLQDLEILEVSTVSGVEVIATREGGDEIVMFPRLKSMRLEILPNLKSFCWSEKGGEDRVQEENNIPQQQALFNNKVRFPALEELKIKELKSLIAIWDNQLFPGFGAQYSFPQLRLVNVQDCEKLVNVIPPNAFPILQKLESLEVVSCNSVVSGVEVASIEGGSDDILMMFPQLKELKLEELPKLSSFYCSRRGEKKAVEESNISHPRTLFNHKVEFAVLEKLVCDGSIFEVISLGHLPTSGSFSKVRLLEVKKYSNLVNGCRQLLQWFEVIEEVSLKSCYSLEVMFNLKGVDDAIQRKAIIVMSSQLKHLTMIDLPKLKRVWIMDPRGGLLMFHNLTSLTVEKCNSLRYLFSLSIARRLTQLNELVVKFCDAMEEIVVINEEQGGEEDSTDKIVFSQLSVLRLEDLPKLTSFCGANNAAFKFPSLNLVGLQKCPKLQTFASGGISTPPDIHVMGDDLMFRSPSELNKYVQQQQYVGKGKGLLMVGNIEAETSL